MKYNLITAEYIQAKQTGEEIAKLLSNDFSLDKDNPQIVFVVGGDGTFLRTIHRYKDKLDEIVFIPLKFGGVGFYTSCNKIEDLKNHFNEILKLENISNFSLLQATSGDKTYYSINEIKIFNNIRPIHINISINNILLETFKGTGLVFSTPSGSTGFNKSSGGAVIYPNQNLFQMQELFPVSTNKFRTLNAPIIFSGKEEITLEFLTNEIDQIQMSIDTFKENMSDNKLTICLSKIEIKILNISNNKNHKIDILRDIFILNNETKEH